MMKSIKVQNLNFSYKNGNKIFSDSSFSLKSEEGKGKVVVIMGPSGSGKTTFFKLFLGIEKCISGSILLNPLNAIISYVPQEPVLFEHLSIEQNARYFQFAGAYKKNFDEVLYSDLVNALNLKDLIKSKRSVTEISGGQKQRLSLLRALSINPQFLLLDEPGNGLDAEVKLSFLNKLREITEEFGLFVLYITHHKLEAQLIADEVIYFAQDKVTKAIKKVVTGTITQFIEAPPILDAAKIFWFPDIKILPITKSDDGTITIVNSNEAMFYWLISDSDIELSFDDGYLFKILSKSPEYSVLKHIDKDVEWIIPSVKLGHYNSHDEVKIKFVKHSIEYDKNGLILNKSSIN